MTFHDANVTEPLASAGRITSRGHRVFLDDESESARILHKTTGTASPLYRKKGNMLVMRPMGVPGRASEGCQGQGHMLDESGFPRQETRWRRLPSIRRGG